jgi:hypothetical protein
LEEHIASIFRIEEYAKQDTSVKAGSKQSHRLARVSDYMGIRREMEAWTSSPTNHFVVLNSTKKRLN